MFYFSDIVYQLIEEQIRCYNQVFLVGPGSNTDWSQLVEQESAFDDFVDDLVESFWN